MNLNCEFKTEYMEILDSKFTGEDIKASLPVNIIGGKYDENGVLIITERHLAFIKDINEYFSYAINEFKEFKTEAMVGQGSLEAVSDGKRDIEICRFSMEYMPRYSAVCKELNKKIKGEKWDFSNSAPDRRCDKCGRVLPEGTRICIKCINKKDTFKKLIGLIDKKYKPKLILSFVLLASISGLTLVSPFLTKKLINDVFYKFPEQKNYSLLAALIAGIIIIQIFIVIFNIILGRTATKLSNGISHDMRQTVFNKIESLPIAALNTKKTGDLMYRVTTDTDRIRQFIQNDLVRLLSQIVTLIAVFILLFILNWKTALLILVPVPAIYIAYSLFRKKVRWIYHIQWRLSARADSILQDIISGIRIVKAFGKEENEIARYKKASRDFAERNIYNERLWALINPMLQFLLNFGVYFIYLYVGGLVLASSLNIGDLVQFTTYANNVYMPLRNLVNFPKILANTAASAGRIFEILDEETSLFVNENPVKIGRLRGEVKIENVSFGYNTFLDVLKDISINVKPGEMIGICGHSGSGKSTLISLILRFYDPEEGNIFIDGINVKEIDTELLRNQMGAVLQETYLFSGSIKENIAFSKHDATDEEIIEAAKIANAHDFIVAFADGYNTRIGERGQNLSGGEKQRIAIARAIIHDPRILILDEATSSLDTNTEFLIQEALARLVKGRTTFAIAHRLSTLKNADRLLVLDHGELAELGTHEELINKKGVYYNLVMAQKKMAGL